jgi:hypothetical protein
VEPIYRLHPLHESPSSKKKRKRGAETSAPDGESDAALQAGASEPGFAKPSQGQKIVPLPESASTNSSLPDVTVPLASKEQRYDFYLFRPRTSSARRVLIPLASSSTLGEILRGNIVEEFPTIYYFTTSASELPEGFVLDEQYRQEEGEQQKEYEELMRDVDPEILKRLKENETGSSKREEEVDSKKILDVLKQDLCGL